MHLRIYRAICYYNTISCIQYILPYTVETVNNAFQKIREVWISNDFLKINIYNISIEFWIRNTLLQKFLQTDMIFFDQFNVPTIKFGKCFAEFMIPIDLLKGVGS